MSDCIFCKIANHEVKAQIVHEDDEVVAFKDLNPGAPVHILVVPKKHIPGIVETAEEDAELVGRLVLAAKNVARQESITDGGFRIVVNYGADAGQSVPHLHFHLLGGRSMGWPPG
jgi:histidine triad (HIT) family protein